MSPAPARTSRDAILAAAGELLEAGGLDAVTMAAVAARVGVRAPSLYKHVPDRAALVAVLAEASMASLGAVVEAAIADAPADPAERLRRAATAYRAFAHRFPRRYGLVFADLPPEMRPPVEVGARAAAPIIALAGALVDPTHALAAARLLTAFVHGFVSMELAGAFRLGGDPAAAFEEGLERLIAGLRADLRGAAD